MAAVRRTQNSRHLNNDFEAIGHAIEHVDAPNLVHLRGTDADLPEIGVVSVVGPGTGLGVALLIRGREGYEVIATEGGHISFAPLDASEDAILAYIRRQHARVSVERVASGQGLTNIYEAISAFEGRSTNVSDHKALWDRALQGQDSLASAALERFFMCLGAIVGDVVLMHGAVGLVIARGLGLALRHTCRLPVFQRVFGQRQV